MEGRIFLVVNGRNKRSNKIPVDRYSRERHVNVELDISKIIVTSVIKQM